MELTADFKTIVNRKSAASFLMYADRWPRIVPAICFLEEHAGSHFSDAQCNSIMARQVHPFVFETLPARNVLNDSCR